MSNVRDEEETTARLLGHYADDGASGIMPATRPRGLLRRGVYLASSGRSYALRAPSILIGRSRHCRVVLDDRRVSHEHAMLFITAYDVTLEDLGSVNGTWLNGVRLSEPQSLRDQDRIIIGSQELCLSSLPDETSPVPESVRPRVAVAGQRPRDILDERTGSLMVLAGAAAKKLVEGDAAGAEAIVRDALMMVLVRAYGGQPVPEQLLSAASRQALSLALALHSARWVNYVFELHVRAGLPKDPGVARLLAEAVSSIRGLDRALVAEYLELLEDVNPCGEARWLAIMLRSLRR